MRIDALMRMLNDAWERQDYRLVLSICAFLEKVASENLKVNEIKEIVK